MRILLTIILLMLTTSVYARDNDWDLYAYSSEKPNTEVFIGRHMTLDMCLSKLAIVQMGQGLTFGISMETMQHLSGGVYRTECRNGQIARTITTAQAERAVYPRYVGCAWANTILSNYDTKPCKW